MMTMAILVGAFFTANLMSHYYSLLLTPTGMVRVRGLHVQRPIAGYPLLSSKQHTVRIMDQTQKKKKGDPCLLTHEINA